MSDSIKKLQELFSRFPTVGHRTAGRFVYYLINQPQETTDELIAGILDLKKSISFCSFCFQPFPDKSKKHFDGPVTIPPKADLVGEDTLCGICTDSLRNKGQLCIVEKEQDLLTIEKTGRYKGVYFILGGSVTLRKTDDRHLRIEPLKERIGQGNFSEIIVALNPTPEGRTTSTLIERSLKELPNFPSLKITHLAKGLPVGGELEYADDETLESAFEGRK